jgi:hypothetical protein
MSSNVAVDSDGSPVELGPVGQEVVFENDQVRIWEISLKPGEQQTWHHHLNPYVVVALEAADNRIDALSGGEPRLVYEPVGGIVYREPGEVHKLTNHGQTTYRSRLIELKYLGEGIDGPNDVPREAR